MSSPPPSTPFASIDKSVAALRAAFRKNQRRGDVFAEFERRTLLLDSVKRLAEDNVDEIVDALSKDLGRHPSLSKMIIGGCAKNAEYCMENLEAWMMSTDLGNLNGRKCEVQYASGRGPHNRHMELSLSPCTEALCAALAAGNNVVVKLSEVSVNSSRLLGDLISKYLPSHAVAVVQGAVPEATHLLKQKFDMIFYTGNTAVGKVIMKAAAEHLTPVVLELGGKNPAIVGMDADLDNAARKIVDGRFKNTGQFCVAPDYVLCEEDAKDLLIAKMKAAGKNFGHRSQTSSSYSRIVNTRHAARVAALIDSKHGGKIICGKLRCGRKICR